MRQALLIVVCLATGCRRQGFSARPTFTLDESGEQRFEVGLTKNIESVSFSNLIAGKRVAIIWKQDRVGNHTVVYGPLVENTCLVNLKPESETTQILVVTVEHRLLGIGCLSDDLESGGRK